MTRDKKRAMHPDEHAKLLLLGWVHDEPLKIGINGTVTKLVWLRPLNWRPLTATAKNFPVLTEEEALAELLFYSRNEAEKDTPMDKECQHCGKHAECADSRAAGITSFDVSYTWRHNFWADGKGQVVRCPYCNPAHMLFRSNKRAP